MDFIEIKNLHSLTYMINVKHIVFIRALHPDDTILYDKPIGTAGSYIKLKDGSIIMSPKSYFDLTKLIFGSDED